MASGQIFVLTPTPPGLLYALEDIYTSSATATSGAFENVPVWAYNAATSEHMDFHGRLVGYGGGGLTLYVGYLCTTTATNSVVIGAGFRRVDADTEDLDVGFAYDYNYATDLQPATIGTISDFTVTFTNGADMDSIANNEAFIMRLRRNATATGDTTTVNSDVLQGAFALKET